MNVCIVAFIFQDASAWSQVMQSGPIVVVLVLVLWFLVRAMPTWKELRLKDMELRADENVVKGQQALALGQLAEALKDIAVEQRKATENIEISQRVNAHSTEQIVANVSHVSRRLDAVENKVHSLLPSDSESKPS